MGSSGVDGGPTLTHAVPWRSQEGSRTWASTSMQALSWPSVLGFHRSLAPFLVLACHFSQICQTCQKWSFQTFQASRCQKCQACQVYLFQPSHPCQIFRVFSFHLCPKFQV